MDFIPYLSFNGNCREAFDFYAVAFNGKITMRITFGESPAANDMPPETHDQVMHSQLETAHGVLMGTDGEPHAGAGNGVVNVVVATPEDAERVFKALADGGIVQLPLGETSWAHRFGMLTDRYGKAWMVNCVKTMDA
jgi:PhnB protein